MITLDEAIKIIQQYSVPIGTETVVLANCLNRVLAEDVYSDINIPPFNKSAMDGFACKKDDLPGPLKVVDEIPAGKFPTIAINHGECARIMTGAPIPVGADTVFMIEYHVVQPDGRVLFTNNKTASNICLMGEDVKIGELVLAAETFISPKEIATLAGAGKDLVKVYQMPRVGVISTGAELVEPNTLPSSGQIRNSNGPQMMAQLAGMGIAAVYFGIAPDDKENLRQNIENALDQSDVLFVSGGVSVGDYDIVPQVLSEIGFEILITTISTKPGKHTLFAVKDGKYVLGFPGNPVSSYVQLEMVGKYLLYQLMGHTLKEQRFQVVLADDYMRKGGDRLEFLPVAISETGQAKLLAYNGSAHIHALSKASALMEIPVGTKSFNKGDMVYVRPL